MRRLALTLAAAAALTAPLLAATPASAAQTISASFRGGSGNYLATSGTDGLRHVSGSETFSQSATGANLSVSGSVSGLQPNTPYVTVPYKDGECLPLAGVTAFPSTAFVTDANGSATFATTVNAGAINPTGVLDVPDIHSVSVRQVIINGIYLPGLLKLPTIPNVGAVETCDRHPA
jgi:hypothetical protein